MTRACSALQQVMLIVLRVAIGWHLFLQGYGKVVAHGWTARGYLADATGPLAGIFHAMAADARWTAVADRVTIWALMVLGLLLMAGLFSRLASLAGAALLFSFYVAAAPVPAGMVVPTVDGTEWFVNKLLIEVLALSVVAVFPTGRMAGLDLLLADGAAIRARRSREP